MLFPTSKQIIRLVRSFVTYNPLNSTYLAVLSDADKDKLDILNYIKGKTGIYM